MYEKLEACPTCQATNFENALVCKDHSNTGESFAIVKCPKCKLLFTNPRPAEDHIGKYYEHKDYISHTNRGNNPINLIYKLARLYTLNRKHNLISQLSQGKALLDFGCGAGEFLRHMSQLKYNITGYEPSQQARVNASKHFQNEILTDIHKIEPNKYDIITAWHVIEHVHQLKKTLQILRNALHVDGKLLIAVPNIESADRFLYQEKWAAFDVPRHLYHFSQESMTTLIKKSKLKLHSIHPLKLDAYYVSLLSEKYISGNTTITGIINAIKSGIRSNQSARDTGEYSSLIYILTK